MGVGSIDRRGRSGIAPSPGSELVLSVILADLCLVQTSEVAVVALVKPPVSAHWDVRSAESFEDELRGADGPGLHGGVCRIGYQFCFTQLPSSGPGFILPCHTEIAVVPASEPIGGVPLALAVAKQD